MPNWILISFLFLPNKVQLIKFQLVLFYVGAGLLKLDGEWLNGVALPFVPLFKGKWIEFTSLLVVFFELFIVWGLLSRSRNTVNWILGLLLVFHAYSYLIVGFMYPATMFCLLSIFVLTPPSLESSFKSFATWSRPAQGVLLLLATLQLLPHLIGQNPSIDGKGRFLALNMMDTNPHCDFFMFARYKDKTLELESLTEIKTPRGRCEPWIFYYEARHQCRLRQMQPDFINIDAALLSRRSVDLSYQKIFELKDFCTAIKFPNFFPNLFGYL